MSSLQNIYSWFFWILTSSWKLWYTYNKKGQKKGVEWLIVWLTINYHFNFQTQANNEVYIHHWKWVSHCHELGCKPLENTCIVQVVQKDPFLTCDWRILILLYTFLYSVTLTCARSVGVVLACSAGVLLWWANIISSWFVYLNGHVWFGVRVDGGGRGWGKSEKRWVLFTPQPPPLSLFLTVDCPLPPLVQTFLSPALCH